MHGTIFLWVLIIWSTDALSEALVFKNCTGECVPFGYCQIAKVLLRKNDPAATAQIVKQTCGLNPDTYIPLLCCSELHDVDSEASSGAAGRVESHPNLRLLPESCGHIDGDKIIGGIEAGLFEYPWMALIAYHTRDGLEFKCGGFLINERYVLTAAHCVVNQRIAGVRVGDHDFLDRNYCQGAPPKMVCELRVQDIRVQQEIPHANFSFKQNDIALLRLQKPVNFEYKNVGTLCLPVTKALLNREIVGLSGTVAGWGFTEHQDFSSKLLAVTVPITSRGACESPVQFQNRYPRGNNENIDQNKICAGMFGKDSCRGDSGGPLMLKDDYRGSGQRYVAYGIVSYGPINCGTADPGIYTDVTKYMEWILDNIQP